MSKGGLMSLVAYGAQDVYLAGSPNITFFDIAFRRDTHQHDIHKHECYLCTQKHCCKESTDLFCCQQHIYQSTLELNLCCQDQIPSELINILTEEIAKLVTPI